MLVDCCGYCGVELFPSSMTDEKMSPEAMSTKWRAANGLHFKFCANLFSVRDASAAQPLFKLDHQWPHSLSKLSIVVPRAKMLPATESLSNRGERRLRAPVNTLNDDAHSF